MSNYAIVGDERIYNTDKLTNEIRRITNGEINLTQSDLYLGIDDLIDSMKRGVVHNYDNMQSILVLDYAFEDSSKYAQSAEEFMELQDMMQTLGMTKVKLYLFTRNSDLYHLLQGEINGYPGMIYENTEIMLFEQQAIADMVRVMRGEMDGSGYRTPRKKTKTRVEQYEENKRQLEEENRQISQEVLDFEKDTQESKLNKEEYINTPQAKEKEKRIEKEREEKIRQFEKEGKKYYIDNWGEPQEYIEEDLTDIIEDDEDDLYVKYDLEVEDLPKPQKKVGKVHTNGVETVESVYTEVNNIRNISEAKVPKIMDIKLLYDKLKDESMGVVDKKLQEDVAIILVTSLEGSGGSGMVAQVADAYAMVGRRVCIIDLDLEKRSQSRYYPNFDLKVSDMKGIKNAVLNVADGGRIDKVSVQVNSRISVCGLTQNFGRVAEGRYKPLELAINDIVLDAVDAYDIVLIDCPIKKLEYYVKSLYEVDRVLFVVENKEYRFEELFRDEIERLIEIGADNFLNYLANSTVVLNKVKESNRDSEGYLINEEWAREKIGSLGKLYEHMLVAGEIPYVEDFEQQYLTNRRYIWDDFKYRGIIKKMLNVAI